MYNTSFDFKLVLLAIASRCDFLKTCFACNYNCFKVFLRFPLGVPLVDVRDMGTADKWSLE